MAVTFNRVSLPPSQAGGNLTFTITSSTGNILLILIVVDAGVTVSSVTDSKGQTYQLDSTTGSSTSGTTYAAYKFKSASGVTSITVNKTAGGCSIAAYDLSSITGGAVDNDNALNNQSGANPSITIAASAAEVCAAVVSCSAVPAGTTGNFIFDLMDFNSLAQADSAGHYQNPSAGTQTCTFTVASSTWGAYAISIGEAALPGSTETIYEVSDAADFQWGGGEIY